MGAVIRNKVTRADLASWNGVTPTVTRQDATGGTVTGLMIGNEVDVLQVYGSGTDRTRASIASAISDISASSNVTLVFAPGTWTIDANLTIASNFTCHIPAGCVFSVDSGVTLTFSGLINVEYPATWTSGSGTVVVSLEGSHFGVYHRTAAERTASITPTNLRYEPGDARRYGCTANDGSTDESTQWQNCIDGNKGGVAYIPEGLTVYAAGALLSGSTYDDTKIIVRGTFKLKASAGATNFQSTVWVGIIVHNCDNVTVEILDADGNRANQADVEGQHILVIAGATKFKVPIFHCREIRGDGIYISQATLTSSSTNSSDGYLGAISGINSADDGRNLVSVISCDGLHIDSVYSDAIGGTIAAANMPGGLDLEPSQTFHSITDVTVGNVNVTTAGTSGVQVLGKAITNDATGDWNVSRVTIGRFSVRKTGTTTTAASFLRAFDLEAHGSVSYATTRGTGCILDYLDRTKIAIKTKFTTVGVVVGNDGSVNDFDIHVNVDDYSTVGLNTISPQRGTFRGRVYDASSATDTFAIRTRSNSRGITQTGVIFEVDAPYDALNIRAFRNETADTVTYGTGTCARNCDWSGYTSFSVQCDGNIPTHGIRGRNIGQATVQPANGNWALGDIVYNFAPSAGEPLGWMRLTSGSGAVANTDWVTIGGLISANAYTPTNVTTDRAYDADTVVVAELADVVGTLIADLQSSGVLK